MATVKIEKFGGIAPRLHPTQLADGMAVDAHNCKLENGKLVPLREPVRNTTIPQVMGGGLDNVEDAKSVHIWKKQDGTFEFLLFGGTTWMAAGVVADDDTTRVIISGDRDGDGDVEEPVVYLRDATSGAPVIVPIRKNPLAAPRVKRLSTEDLGSDRRYTRYFYSWVDAYGMESPPSPPSLAAVTFTAEDGWSLTNEGQTSITLTHTVEGTRTISTGDIEGTIEKDGNTFVSVTAYVDEDLVYNNGDRISFAAIGTANWPSGAVAIRVYKVIAGLTGEGHNQFVKEIGIDEVGGSGHAGQYGFAIAERDENAGETMPEMEAPPDDLTCIHNVPGSFYVGFSPSKPKTVYFSDVDLLYSWPEQYRYDIADNIVALAVTANNVFALTDGWPYVLTGTAPESMTVAKIAGPAACVSPRGVCVYHNAVYYASNAGLMTIQNNADAGTVCRNLTEGIFTKDQWLALKPSSCVMEQHDGALLLSFESGAGYRISLTESGTVAVTTHDEPAASMCVDTGGDELYYVRREV